MSRSTKPAKPYIVVFCEGESEQAYTDFLRKEFKDVASIHRPKATGLFDVADSKYKKDTKYRETKDIGAWESRLKIINRLRSLRKDPNIKVRLLMTTGCIEYWLMLHYEMYAPPIQTVADKTRVINRLLSKEPLYKKGDTAITAKIARAYLTAVTNAKRTVSNLLQDGLSGIEDTDERNRWLCQKCLTFSTVYEAIDYLGSLEV